jgi:hypothetical protein
MEKAHVQRKGGGEVMPILEHWLDSLHTVVYNEAFREGWRGLDMLS